MQQERFQSWFALIATVALASYQLFLCFINTHVFPVTNAIVAATEACILMAVAARILPRKELTDFALPALVAAYFFLLFMVRGEIDPQGLRNLFVIYIMFQLGCSVHNLRDLNRIVWTLSFIVALLCFFEYFLIDAYLGIFNIKLYFAARGVISQEQLSYSSTNLYTSGIRPVGRIMLPFLGDQRISSLFLEPVSMGNYAAIICMWAFSFDKENWRGSLGHFLAGVFFIIASDSRFASIIVIVLFAVRLFPPLQKTLLLYLLPVLIVAGQAFFVQTHIADARMDDLPGRLAKAGETLLAMSLPEIFGVGNVEILYDMGIPYCLVVFGLALCAFLWIRFVFLQFETRQGARLRAMLCVYCLGLLLISGTSFFSTKTAGLLWLIAGALYRQGKLAKAGDPALSAPLAQNTITL